MSGPSPAAPAGAAFKARFGENLTRCRKAADVSQEELGLRASLHRTEISLLERGERVPRLDTVLRIACCLEVGVDDLLSGLAWTPGGLAQGAWEVTGSGPRSREALRKGA